MSLVSKLTDSYLVSTGDAEEYVEYMEELWENGLPFSERYGPPSDKVVHRGETVQDIASMKIEHLVSAVMYSRIGKERVEPYIEVRTNTAKEEVVEEGSVRIEYESEEIFPGVLKALQLRGRRLKSFVTGIREAPFHVSFLGVSREGTYTDLASSMDDVYSFLEYTYDEDEYTYMDERSNVFYEQAKNRVMYNLCKNTSSLFERTFLNTRRLYGDENRFEGELIRRQVARNEITRYGLLIDAVEAYKRKETEALGSIESLDNGSVLSSILQPVYEENIRLSRSVIECLEEYPDEEPFIP